MIHFLIFCLLNYLQLCNLAAPHDYHKITLSGGYLSVVLDLFVFVGYTFYR